MASDPKRYLIPFAIGFAIALLGHITRTRTLVVAGLAIVFAATFVLPLYFYLSGQ